MFFLIGLGLGDAKDITVKGLEIVRKCERVYLESYTSILTVGKEALEEFYGKELIIADREMCESGVSEMLEGSLERDIALLVVGDPLGATTHTDLILRAVELKIPYQVVQNTSIINAVACCGLQLYTFGEVISIPFWTENWKPDSFYNKIMGNFTRNLHTLCLLDIKVKEPTEESLTKKVRKYMDPKFMSVKEACIQLSEIIERRNKTDGDSTVNLNEDTTVVGLARIGSETQRIHVCSLKEMCNYDLGPPLHSLVIPAKELHPLEIDFLNLYREK